jgi:hypothetical protein
MTTSTCSSSIANSESQASWVIRLTKAYYQDDQQTKFMHLQAEVDSLLQELQNLKSEKVGNTSQVG